MTEFKLTEKEIEARDKFISLCRCKKRFIKDQWRKQKTGKYKYKWVESCTFAHSSGIGVSVTMNFGPYSKDITDYESW